MIIYFELEILIRLGFVNIFPEPVMKMAVLLEKFIINPYEVG